jgi:predicted transcriptional regulator
MDNVCNLLFELSSTDRIDILLLLNKTPLKLSHVADKLNFTVQETSRNITRLSHAKLIAKDTEGSFHLTPFGEEALSLLSGFRFLSKNREYFLTHTVNALPKQFELSLGMLENSAAVNDVMLAFHNVEEMIATAQEFVWIITNQILASTVPYLTQALERGAEFKLIMPKDYNPSQSTRQIMTNPIFTKAIRANKMDMRLLERVDVFLCLSEKEVAALGFPTAEGKLDYNCFKAGKEPTVQWAKTLFEYYWGKASNQLPDKLANP